MAANLFKRLVQPKKLKDVLGIINVLFTILQSKTGTLDKAKK